MDWMSGATSTEKSQVSDAFPSLSSGWSAREKKTELTMSATVIVAMYLPQM